MILLLNILSCSIGPEKCPVKAGIIGSENPEAKVQKRGEYLKETRPKAFARLPVLFRSCPPSPPVSLPSCSPSLPQKRDLPSPFGLPPSSIPHICPVNVSVGLMIRAYSIYL